MKNFKGFALGLVIGLALAISSIGFAQNTTQTDPSKAKESCCAMASCCCAGDSCSMMKHNSKEQSAKDGHCCCCGDSCDMKMKEKGKETHKDKQG